MSTFVKKTTGETTIKVREADVHTNMLTHGLQITNQLA
jgi:hypothetical protein